MNLHIIIFSTLYDFAGGRETWLGYFVPEIRDRKIYSKIYIYHISASESEDHLSEKIMGVNFVGLLQGDWRQYNPILKGALFSFQVFRQLLHNVSAGDTVIMLGTLFETLSGVFAKLFLGRKIRLVTWIRSISKGEVATRRGRIYISISTLLEKLSFKYSDLIIANGNDTCGFYKQSYPIFAERIHVIENAVYNKELFSMPMPSFNANKIIIGYIGRLVPEKGFDQFCESVQQFYRAEMDEMRCQIEFHVWGHGGQNKSMPPEVIIHGPVKRCEINKVISQCHCLVFLNRWEGHAAGGLSHGLLEAMAAARLIVAWDNPIHSQVISETNGILVEEGNIEKLTEVYYELLKMQDHNSKVRCVSARDKAKGYSVLQHVNKYIELLS